MKQKRRRQTAILALLCCGLLLSGCGAEKSNGSKQSSQTESTLLIDRLLNLIVPQQRYKKNDESVVTVRDTDSLYTEDTTPIVLYVTVSPGKAGEGTNHTWEELHEHDLTWYREQDEDPYKCAALVQTGNETGPVFGGFGYSDSSANATIRLSGTRSSARQQKSYRVMLNENSGTLSGMKEFVLQKSFTDPFRFTNKLAFDLIALWDGLLSTRTCFAHLYVRDLAADEDALFVDYGLYTLIEPVNKQYLKNRNLDKSGELYKAVDFDFARHEDVIVQPTDVRYSSSAFKELLEPKGSKDYSGLIAMLDAVNDYTLPIEDTVERYFNEESLYSWLAVNLLLDNRDTDTENFYLYRPLGSEQFYIIPWDFDASLRSDYEKLRDPNYSASWKKGIFLYTESVLFRRIMESEHCTNHVSEYMDELHDSIFLGRRVQRRAEELSETVLDYLYELPDKSYARVTKKDYKKLLERIGEQVDENFYTYYDTLMTPWPFHILEPETRDGQVILRWEPSAAMNQKVTYTVELADAWDFSSLLLKVSDYEGTSCDAGKLPAGQYFVRVTAKAENGYAQEAYEVYNTEKKTTVYGVLCFYVQEENEP